MARAATSGRWASALTSKARTVQLSQQQIRGFRESWIRCHDATGSAAVPQSEAIADTPTVKTPDEHQASKTTSTSDAKPQSIKDGPKGSKDQKRKNHEITKSPRDGDFASRPKRNWPRQDSASEPRSTKNQEVWQTQKEALRQKFPDGWRPRKRLSPDALAGIRALNAQFPDMYTTEALADRFEVSAEAIRRILKSKWQPSVEEEQDRQERWFRRGKQVWEHKAAVGVKPPRKWRREGITRKPSYHGWKERMAQRERELEEREVDLYKKQRGGRGGTAL